MDGFCQVCGKAGFLALQNIGFHAIPAERDSGEKEVPFQFSHQILASAIGKTEITDYDVKRVCFREGACLGDGFRLRDSMTLLGKKFSNRLAGWLMIFHK